MGNEWREITLGEVCEIRRGSSPRPIVNYLTRTSGMPWVKIADATECDSRFINKTSQFIKEEGVCRSVIVQKGDLILSNSGTAGLPKFINLTACIHDGWQVLRNFRGINKEFLYYTLIYIRPNLLHNAYDSTMKNLTLEMVRDAKIKIPSLEEQECIAHVLGTFDDKLELNERMNTTLEAMAMELFQSWFVDFNPVRRNAEGVSPSPEDSLFPNSFGDSLIGEIPTGWKVMPLYETAIYRNGAPFKPADFCLNGEGLPVIKIAELKSGLSEQTKWSNKQLGSDQMIDTGDLLYSWSGSPDTSLDAFLWSNGPGLVNQHIFKVITSNDAEKRFVYYLLKHLRPILVETARDKQTTGLGHVTVADMKRLQVCRPPKDVLAAFDRLIAPIFDKAFANTVESQTLATLRDTLLPKLLSGEINS